MPSRRRGPATPAPPAVSAAPIYLDHNATTPLDARVLAAMMPYLTTEFGNAASRTHAFGHVAHRAVEGARANMAALLNVDANELFWTSGATESNNLAIKGVARHSAGRGRHIVTQATEHPSVLDPFRWLAGEGFEVTVLPVDGSGRVDPAQVADALRPDTTLVSIMWANNEVGTVQSIRDIAASCAARGVLFHTDATQAVGKMPIDLRACPVDLLSLSAHKFYGPKGCGALYVRQRSPRIELTPLFHGGGQERGRRSGTANVPGIVGLGEAAKLCRQEMAAEGPRLRSLRDRFERRVIGEIVDARVNGDASRRLPHTSHFTFDGVAADALLVALGDVAASTGSACTSSSVAPSHVLTAMGFTEGAIDGSVRFGIGRQTTDEQLDRVAERLTAAVSRLRSMRSFA